MTLEELFQSTGKLQSNILVSSTLIKEMEIYGYVNTCKGDDFLCNPSSLQTLLNGIVDKASSNEIVCSNFIYQVFCYYNGSKIQETGRTIPVYQKLELSADTNEYNLEDLYFPSLVGNLSYKHIKRRVGIGVNVTEKYIKHAHFPSNITAKEGKAIVTVEKGSILCKDKENYTRSIGEEVMAVCRYIHPITGATCYAQYNLDELYIDL